MKSFYYNKMHNLCKALAIVMGHSPALGKMIIERFEATIYPEEFPPDQKPPIHEGHLMYLLTLNYYVQHTKELGIDNESLDSILMTLNQQVNED